MLELVDAAVICMVEQPVPESPTAGSISDV
jgi:hypothetical protein